MSQTTAQETRPGGCNYRRVVRDDADSSITLSKGSTHSLGPVCGTCGANEARCAFVGGCCDGCSHFDPPARQRLAEHGTDSGYYRHRREPRTEPCAPCKAAHARSERERKS